MSKNLIILTITAVVLVPLQVLVFEHLALFGLGFSFIYLLFLMLLPVELGHTKGMGIALLTGLLVDIFAGTVGIHAASAVFIMFLRPFWLKVIIPRSGFDVNVLPGIRDYGLVWFIVYSGPLFIIYTLTFFFIEAGGSRTLWIILAKSGLTSVISLVFVVTIQYLFYPKKKV